jgi:Ca2+-binding EF-hand superfamily protein
VAQAFEQFDVNKNGHLNKKEMFQALRRLGIDNLSENELERIIE